MQHHRFITRLRALCCIAGLALAASGACLAAGLSLDVAPGLWEVVTSGAVSGNPQIPPELLARMRPEQRLMTEALAQAIIAQASMPHNLQICVTPQQVQRGLDFTRMGGRDCRQSVQSRSPTGLDVEVACGGRDRMSGTVHLRAVDRQTVLGNVDMHGAVAGATAAIRETVHARWLAAACGDVQPFE